MYSRPQLGDEFGQFGEELFQFSGEVRSLSEAADTSASFGAKVTERTTLYVIARANSAESLSTSSRGSALSGVEAWDSVNGLSFSLSIIGAVALSSLVVRPESLSGHAISGIASASDEIDNSQAFRATITHTSTADHQSAATLQSYSFLGSQAMTDSSFNGVSGSSAVLSGHQVANELISIRSASRELIYGLSEGSGSLSMDSQSNAVLRDSAFALHGLSEETQLSARTEAESVADARQGSIGIFVARSRGEASADALLVGAPESLCRVSETVSHLASIGEAAIQTHSLAWQAFADGALRADSSLSVSAINLAVAYSQLGSISKSYKSILSGATISAKVSAEGDFFGLSIAGVDLVPDVFLAADIETIIRFDSVSLEVVDVGN